MAMPKTFLAVHGGARDSIIVSGALDRTLTIAGLRYPVVLEHGKQLLLHHFLVHAT
jgi:hypothetical protein